MYRRRYASTAIAHVMGSAVGWLDDLQLKAILTRGTRVRIAVLSLQHCTPRLSGDYAPLARSSARPLRPELAVEQALDRARLLERGDVFEGNRTLIEGAERSWRTALAD